MNCLFVYSAISANLTTLQWVDDEIDQASEQLQVRYSLLAYQYRVSRRSSETDDLSY